MMDVEIKEEGATVRYDCELTEESEPGYWMELRINESWTRERIHREVDEWLDEERPNTR